jgi:hypothetical protein
VQGGDGLRGYLGKDQDDQRQQEGGDDDTGVAVETDGDDRGDRRGGDVDEVVADQDQADQPVRTLEQLAGALGTAVRCLRRCFRR